MNINKNYLNVNDSYLFSEIARRVDEFKAANPEREVIRLGIGDVTRPLAPVVVSAMRDAAAEMGNAATFRGYRSDGGYEFLREAVAGYYAGKGVTLDISEIFVSDGAKSDISNILDVFDAGGLTLIPDPVYPVYVDTNVMTGRKIAYLSGGEENGFLPMPDPAVDCDIIYLCSPNNPTGAVYNREQLKAWVDYANEKDAVILFDAAYEAFIGDPALPSSIYQIEGAKSCAVELASLSKTAGFTGVRCGYTVVPNELTRGGVSLNKLWARRQSTKFNGVSYIVQRGAEAVFSAEGMRQNRENIAYYKKNASIIADAFRELGYWFCGGENSPYIWFKCPNGMYSWDYFDYLLRELNVVGTPGVGFGAGGTNFLRLTAFGAAKDVETAVARIKAGN